MRSSGLPRPKSGVARGWSNDAPCASFDHFRNDEIMIFPRRRVCQDRVRVAAVGDDVGALLHAHGGDRGHRLDAGDVDLVELLDERQNGVELALQVLDLVVVDGDAREVRDAAHGRGVDGHADSLSYTVTGLPLSGT